SRLTLGSTALSARRQDIFTSMRSNVEYGTSFPFPVSGIPEHLLEHILRHPLAAIDHREGRLELCFLDPASRQQRPDHPSIGDSELHVLGGQAKSTHDIDGGSHQLGVGER